MFKEEINPSFRHQDLCWNDAAPQGASFEQEVLVRRRRRTKKESYY